MSGRYKNKADHTDDQFLHFPGGEGRQWVVLQTGSKSAGLVGRFFLRSEIAMLGVSPPTQ